MKGPGAYEYAPECSCSYSGRGRNIHLPDCVRWVWIVEHYKPPGRMVVNGRVVETARKIA